MTREFESDAHADSASCRYAARFWAVWPYREAIREIGIQSAMYDRTVMTARSSPIPFVRFPAEHPIDTERINDDHRQDHDSAVKQELE